MGKSAAIAMNRPNGPGENSGTPDPVKVPAEVVEIVKVVNTVEVDVVRTVKVVEPVNVV